MDKHAKTHILQVIGKWIKNPMSQCLNVLAIQGPWEMVKLH